MKKEDFEKIRNWFYGYVNSHYTDGDEYINSNLKLKEVHTGKVTDEVRSLGEHTGLEDDMKYQSLACGLLHDVGRFEQFLKYRTYKDSESFNHGCYGAGVLGSVGILDSLQSRHRERIITVVRHHGDISIPEGLDEQTVLLLKMVRDADKLDIFRVLIMRHKLYLSDPEKYPLEIEFADSEQYNPQVAQKLLNNELVDYSLLGTLTDMKLLQLGWVFDINFTWTLRQIKERGYIEHIIDVLPEDELLDEVCRHVTDYTRKVIDSEKQQ